jgi:hypothetical protein
MLVPQHSQMSDFGSQNVRDDWSCERVSVQLIRSLDLLVGFRFIAAVENLTGRAWG